MKSNIPVTEFAPGERVPINVVRRQASAVAEIPLSSDLLNSVLTCVCILNPQRQIVFATRNWQELLPGRKPAELLGLRPGEALGCIHAREREAGCGTTVFCRECGAVKAILAGLAGRHELQECHLSRRLNGQEEALELLAYATAFQVKEENYCFFAVTDISHEKRRRALERIFFHEVLASAKDLTALAGRLSERTTDGLQKDLQRLDQGLRDLLEQVQTQSDLAAAENHELTVKPLPLNPGAILQEVVLRCQSQFAAKGRRLCLESDPATAPLISDPTLLKRVLGNLIKNALEAAKPGQTVWAGCEEIGPKVRFEVHNPGYMPKKLQIHMFCRSFSTKGLGRGLGTYSVKLLTEQYLKGQVGFTSDPEKGTTFFILLPKQA